jgi:hypothetical protein
MEEIKIRMAENKGGKMIDLAEREKRIEKALEKLKDYTDIQLIMAVLADIISENDIPERRAIKEELWIRSKIRNEVGM